MELATRKVSRICETPAFESGPSYSPDGKTIAFSAADKVGDASHIYEIQTDGSKRVQLSVDQNTLDDNPCYSPDGKWIAFARAARHRGYSMGGTIWDTWDIFLMDRISGKVNAITHEGYYSVSRPRFDKPGKQIVFSAVPMADNANSRIFLTTIDSGSKPRVVGTERDAYSPTFASNPERILYISDPKKAFEYEVCSANLDGSNVKTITHNHSYNSAPVQIPGTLSVLFLSDPRRKNRYDLWKVNNDGSSPETIADSPLFDSPLSWKLK